MFRVKLIKEIYMYIKYITKIYTKIYVKKQNYK